MKVTEQVQHQRTYLRQQANNLRMCSRNGTISNFTAVLLGQLDLN